ncbi:hypothetical protein [Saccharothrix deserti]|uniref:hypothetical protein n=1 Tax=Saccharothrix deserti TaxID=2593674 RepID=UPI00131E5CD8|nr:hypothetical protein [Saccharothrix deserti]
MTLVGGTPVNCDRTGQERTMNSGCNTSTYWSDVHAGDIDNIRWITIYVCRDTFIPECDSKAFRNPPAP